MFDIILLVLGVLFMAWLFVYVVTVIIYDSGNVLDYPDWFENFYRFIIFDWN